ncbi:MAG: murein hydrolase activator EnvC family protein [Chitinophagales bacterium]
MAIKLNNIILLFATFLLLPNLFASPKDNDKVSLQKKYKNILSDIKGIENLIEETESKKNQNLNQLQSLNAKIGSRLTLIGNINEQIGVLEENIQQKKIITKSMEKDIEALKDDYAKMIYHSYKNLNTTSLISFLLSSETFNQAIRRMNYLKSYAKYRQNQALLIRETISGIKSKVEKLEAEKAEKERLLLEEEHQKEVLETEKLQKDNLVTRLKGDSKKLKSQIKQKNKSAIALNNQIQKIIQEEILAAEAKAKKQAEKGTAAGDAYVSKEIKLSKDFVNNKGKLPWPILKGHIVEKFGTHPHPSLPKVTINNNGVDIRSNEKDVKSVFEGIIVNSFYLPTTQNTLIIKHGEYFSVYSNLESISVNLGDKVKTGQKIGEAYTSAEDNITKVHLEIWKSTSKLNPESWITSTN